MAKVLLITGSDITFAGNASTSYYCLSNGLPSISTVEANSQITYRFSGSLSSLWVNITTNIFTVTDSTIAIRKNGANGNQSILIPAGNTGEFTDLIGADKFIAGDKINYAVTNTGSAAENMIIRSTTNVLKNIIPINTINHTTAIGITSISASNTQYRGFTDANILTLTEANSNYTFSHNQTISNFFVYVEANARTTTITLGTRKNGGNGNLTVSITAGSTGIFEDVSNIDSISSGDSACFYKTSGAGTESITLRSMSLQSLSTNNQFAVTAMDSVGIAFANNATRFIRLPRIISNTLEATVKVQAPFVWSATNLKCYISANTHASDCTLRFRKNGANGNLSVAVTALTTGWFEDTTHTDSMLPNDEVNYTFTDPSTITSTTLNMIGILAKSENIPLSLPILGVG